MGALDETSLNGGCILRGVEQWRLYLRSFWVCFKSCFQKEWSVTLRLYYEPLGARLGLHNYKRVLFCRWPLASNISRNVTFVFITLWLRLEEIVIDHRLLNVSQLSQRGSVALCTDRVKIQSSIQLIKMYPV